MRGSLMFGFLLFKVKRRNIFRSSRTELHCNFLSLTCHIGLDAVFIDIVIATIEIQIICLRYSHWENLQIASAAVNTLIMKSDSSHGCAVIKQLGLNAILLAVW